MTDKELLIISLAGFLGGLLLIGIIIIVTLLILEGGFGSDDISIDIIRHTGDGNLNNIIDTTVDFEENKEIVDEINKSLDVDIQNTEDDISRISKEYEELVDNLRRNKL